MKKRATFSDAIRRALRRGGLTFYPLRARVEHQLRQIIGRARLYRLLAVMKVNGEIVTQGRGETRVYSLPGDAA